MAFSAEVTAANLVNPDRILTKTVQDSRFCLFRGHLSRPACSHVKKLAKQAGDVFDPGRTYRSGRVFYGLMSLRSEVRSKMRWMVMFGVKSVPSPAISADDRSHEVDHPSSQAAL